LGELAPPPPPPPPRLPPRPPIRGVLAGPLEVLLFKSAVTCFAQGELVVSWEISSGVQADGSSLSQK
jgi:hypothetical protein